MGEGRAEAAVSEGWEFGGADETCTVFYCVDERDENAVSTGVESTCGRQCVIGTGEIVGKVRFTIQLWLSGMRTMGDTPQAAIAGTAWCIAASG